jgi:hypothetical protein
MCSAKTFGRTWISLGLLLMSSHSWAQEFSCPKIQAAPGAFGYQPRAKDVRCEGFYHSPVAAEDLELLSLTTGPVSYRLEADEAIRLGVPNLEALKLTQLQVQARAIPTGTYYRMDATVASAKSMNWEIMPVLRPAKLTADAIGVLGWVEQGASKIFVPISASNDNVAAATPMTVVAILRPAMDLERLQWRSRLETSAQPPEWIKVGATQRVLRAGDPVRLELAPANGTRIIEVSAKARGSDHWLLIRFRMFEP